MQKNILRSGYGVIFSGLLFINISNAQPKLETEITEVKVDHIVEEALLATPNLANGKILYRNCAICHSPEGWGSPSGHFPQIAGQHKSVIIKQLTDIQKGNRDNPTMLPFTAPLFFQGSQALADISEYISLLPMVPENNIGYGTQLVLGKKIYDKECKQCHEANGEGNAEKFYPRVQGQHFKYIERQLHWIANGKRRNVDRKMAKQIRQFHFSELAAVSDYISRLKPDKSIVAKSLQWKNPDFRNSFFVAPRR